MIWQLSGCSAPADSTSAVRRARPRDHTTRPPTTTPYPTRYQSGRKCKDRFVFILTFRRFLYFCPEWQYLITKVRVHRHDRLLAAKHRTWYVAKIVRAVFLQFSSLPRTMALARKNPRQAVTQQANHRGKPPPPPLHTITTTTIIDSNQVRSPLPPTPLTRLTLSTTLATTTTYHIRIPSHSSPLTRLSPFKNARI